MDVVGREGWRRRIGDKRLIRVWSEAVCIIKQYDQQQCTVYHQTMALIGFAALLKWDDGHKIFTRRLSPSGTGWKDVFGGTRHSLLQNRAQTPAHHSKSMLINNVMNNWKECFDVVHTKEEKKEGGGHWTNKRNAFFNFWQWQVHSVQSTVAVSVSGGWGRIFKWPALFGRPCPRGTTVGSLFHIQHYSVAILATFRSARTSLRAPFTSPIHLTLH